MPSQVRSKSTAPTKQPANVATEALSTVFTKFVGMLDVRPWQQSRVSLGTFDERHPAKGFSVDVVSEPTTPEAITTRIITLARDGAYELVLQISNRGTTTVGVEIWQM